MANGKKRNSAKNQQRQINRLQSLFFIVLLVVAGYIFLQSSVFSIKEVKITGLETLQDSQIRKMAGINLGTNTFKLNLNVVKSRVEIQPMVKAVTVKRSFPDTIVVSIVERKPVALVPLNSEFMAIDHDGYFLYKVSDYSKANLPIITGLRLGTLTPGKQIVNSGLSTALKFLQKMDIRLVSQLSELNVADPQMLIMYNLEGAEIRLGAAESIEQKLGLIMETLKKVGNRKIKYIDITYAGKPVIMFADTVIPPASVTVPTTGSINTGKD